MSNMSSSQGSRSAPKRSMSSIPLVILMEQVSLEIGFEHKRSIHDQSSIPEQSNKRRREFQRFDRNVWHELWPSQSHPKDTSVVVTDGSSKNSEWPSCEYCKHRHLGDCWRQKGACLHYGSTEHWIHNYPLLVGHELRYCLKRFTALMIQRTTIAKGKRWFQGCIRWPLCEHCGKSIRVSVGGWLGHVLDVVQKNIDLKTIRRGLRFLRFRISHLL